MKDTLICSIFCAFDDFYSHFDQFLFQNSISNGGLRKRKSTMSRSEVMAISVFFLMSNYKKFMHVYLCHLCGCMKSYFPNLVS